MNIPDKKNNYRIFSTTPEHIHFWLIDNKISHVIPYSREHMVLLDTTINEEDPMVGCSIIDDKKIIFSYILESVPVEIQNWFLDSVKETLK